MDKALLGKLRKFAKAFIDLRDRACNESDTVMFITKFFEEILGWDAFSGEITKEHSVKDRYCDVALKIKADVQMLVECKPASQKDLSDKNIEQAENYGSRSGIHWVLLTNGIIWKLYHITFNDVDGIKHELVFTADINEVEIDAEAFWEDIKFLHRRAFSSDLIEKFWAKRQVLHPDTLVRVMFTECVLTEVRREIYRRSKVWLEIQSVFDAVREILSKEALLKAGDITITKAKKKKAPAKSVQPSGPAEDMTQSPSGSEIAS